MTMHMLEAIAATDRLAERRLVAAVDELVRLTRVELPDVDGPLPGITPRAARAELTMSCAVRVEAIVERIRRPLSE